MRRYRPKYLIDGYRVDLKLKGKTLIAIPEEKVRGGISVEYQNEFMRIDESTPVLKALTFQDRFGRNKTYNLLYFEWIPTKQEGLF